MRPHPLWTDKDVYNKDDGSCQFAVFGCTTDDALNYNNAANAGVLPRSLAPQNFLRPRIHTASGKASMSPMAPSRNQGRTLTTALFSCAPTYVTFR